MFLITEVGLCKVITRRDTRVRTGFGVDCGCVLHTLYKGTGRTVCLHQPVAFPSPHQEYALDKGWGSADLEGKLLFGHLDENIICVPVMKRRGV